jgi:hypothetical protein
MPYSDGSGIKKRPSVVLKSEDSKCLMLEINSLKDKHANMNGKRIYKDTPEYKQMGLWEKSIILGSKAWLKNFFLRNKIGTCPFINEYPV